MVKKYWKSVIWAAFILWASLIKVKDIDEFPNIVIPCFDKILHLVVYAILAFLLMLESKFTKLELSKRVARIFVLSVLFGGIIEVLQNYVPTGRNTDIFDFLANFIGVIIGLIAFLKISQIRVKSTD
jgi:VanZ family protein